MKNASSDNDGLPTVTMGHASSEFCNPILSTTPRLCAIATWTDCMIFISTLSPTKYVQPIYLIRFCPGRRGKHESLFLQPLMILFIPPLSACPAAAAAFPFAQFCIPIHCRVAHSGAAASRSPDLRYPLRPVVNAHGAPRRRRVSCEIAQLESAQSHCRTSPSPLLVAVCQYLCSAASATRQRLRASNSDDSLRLVRR